MPQIIQLEIPDDIIEEYASVEEMKRNIYEDIIIREFQKGHLSIGRAAKLLGLTYAGFMIWLGERKVSFITATKEELEESYQNPELHCSSAMRKNDQKR